jgi:hypothetical protein
MAEPAQVPAHGALRDGLSRRAGKLLRGPGEVEQNEPAHLDDFSNKDDEINLLTHLIYCANTLAKELGLGYSAAIRGWTRRPGSISRRRS